MSVTRLDQEWLVRLIDELKGKHQDASEQTVYYVAELMDVPYATAAKYLQSKGVEIFV